MTAGDVHPVLADEADEAAGGLAALIEAQRDLAAEAGADGAAVGAETQPHPAEPIDALAEHLRELGAETEAERRLKRVLPWVTSFVAHLGLIVLGFAVVTAVRLMREEDPVLIVADFNQPRYEPLALMNPNISPETERAAQDQRPTDAAASTLTEQLRRLEIDPLSVISDAASPSELAEFAPRPREATASFVGLTGSNARKIVYIVDASGSMIGTLPIIIEELARSIEALSADQEFAVVFFQRNDALTAPPGTRLMRATAEEKLRVLQWARDTVIPAGRSNPVAAIEKGLSFKPDVIFLLSNNITGAGVFEIDQKDLLDLLDQLNPVDRTTGRRRTQIQCVQFLDPDPLDTLRKIAEIHGGPRGYKFLDRRELGIGLQ